MSDGLNIPETIPPKVEIKTEAQATNYVEGLAIEMEKIRAACAVPYNPKGQNDPTVQVIHRMMWTFLNKQGQVVGALNAFRLAGLISECAWSEMHQRAINALGPTVVGQA